MVGVSTVRGAFRPEIQGLRAIAVLLVLVYHVWPSFLPGGFVGVDVFFVISGYLITSLLLREVERSGSISLPQFYVRRARRLLPAAIVTLFAVVAATALLLPITRWRDVALEVVASTLYFENWWLAFKAVDYLAIEADPSPLQHFWSLSVEEQFYFAWPALLIALAWFSRARRVPFRRAVGAIVSIVLAASLAYSVIAGLSGSSSAYFSTFSRIWQLAAGALVAVVGFLPGRAGVGLLLAGLAGMVLSAIVLDAGIPYPGHAALLPTLSAVLAIAAGGAHERTALTRWLGSNRAIQYLGDISYSLYLWHWPVITFYRAWRGEDPGLWDGAALLGLSVLLAAVSKRYIEDAFRHGPATAGRPWRPLAAAASASIACVAIALVLGRAGGLGVPARDVASGLDQDHPGAAALYLKPARTPREVDFLPKLVDVEFDVASAYRMGCIQDIDGDEVKTCVFGSTPARMRIAVVGDSHAVHWLPAFKWIAEHYDVQVVGITKTSCITAGLPTYHRKLKRPYVECERWTRNVVDYLNAQDFDKVVLVESPRHAVYGRQGEGYAASAEALAQGMKDVWSGFRDRSAVTLIRSTPWQPTIVRECFAKNAPGGDGCTAGRDAALYDDAIPRLARLAGYPMLDFTDLFCPGSACPAVIGNVFVYRDAHHITATYMQTLAPVLRERLGIDGAIARRPGEAAGQVPSLSKVRPAIAAAAADRGIAFDRQCVVSTTSRAVKKCEFGDRDGRITVAVVGDATGANLMPAIDPAAIALEWRVNTYFKDSCLFGGESVFHRRLKRAFSECSAWNRQVLHELLVSKPNIVLLAQSPNYTDARGRSYDQASAQLERGIGVYVRELQRTGIRVAVVKHLPKMPFDVPLCLESRADTKACGAPRQGALSNGALFRYAVSAKPALGLVDLSDSFCGELRCEAVIEDVLVYRDGMQPTATFAKTLSGALERQLQDLLVVGGVVSSSESRRSGD
ncbi:acyltransferase family protein [Marilutibacter spongiae]|uniref:Acyltransferase n=1 Tax=Marilutibacter spongiae TaxID=2025720 RepID=A0A7W3TJ25_9GAMM|nr:acyltransferase family protein [Lysobacter spongiae]MBB1059034.1 acyltransferase [Lysobacter spongiae]